MSEVNKSVNVPTFSGKEEDFELFWPRFEAYADMKGFVEALEWKTPDPSMPAKHDVLTGSDEEQKKQSEALKRNKTAIAAFTLAFKTKACMNMINEAKSEEYPKGLARVVAEELHTMCNPRDRVAKVEATNALRAVKMKKGSKPNKFFNNLKAIKMQYEGDITDEMLINEVMVKAPKKYQSIIATECRTKGSGLKIENLKEAMNELYRMSANSYKYKNDSSSDEDDSRGEVIGSAFQGECFNCGKNGHMSVLKDTEV